MPWTRRQTTSRDASIVVGLGYSCDLVGGVRKWAVTGLWAVSWQYREPRAEWKKGGGVRVRRCLQVRVSASAIRGFLFGLARRRMPTALAGVLELEDEFFFAPSVEAEV